MSVLLPLCPVTLTIRFCTTCLQLLWLRQVRLPPLQAASQLSQAELEELLAENAKLKQLLNTYKDRLSPDQVGNDRTRTVI